MTLRRVKPWLFADADPFESTCGVCDEPIFRPGGTAWTHDEGWRDDEHQATDKEANDG